MISEADNNIVAKTVRGILLFRLLYYLRLVPNNFPIEFKTITTNMKRIDRKVLFICYISSGRSKD